MLKNTYTVSCKLQSTENSNRDKEHRVGAGIVLDFCKISEDLWIFLLYVYDIFGNKQQITAIIINSLSIHIWGIWLLSLSSRIVQSRINKSLIRTISG